MNARYVSLAHGVLWGALLGFPTLGCATDDARPEPAAPVEVVAELPEAVDPEWRSGLLAWRADREQRLRSPDGYLALSDLVWLAEGGNRFGSDPSCALVLPDDGLPAEVGVLTLVHGVVSLELPGSGSLESVTGLSVDPPPLRISVTEVEGHSASAWMLASDMTGVPNRVTLGRRTFWVIDRAGQIGIRVRDPESPVLAGFHGTEWFEPDERWRVQARFESHSRAVAVDIPNVMGTSYDDESPGVLHFEFGGQDYALHPTGRDSESMSLIFGDATNGSSTYGGGRFLGLSAPEADGTVWLDFNRAYNPPCAFSPFTTCPLPPRGNRLELEISAGERLPPGHD